MNIETIIEIEEKISFEDIFILFVKTKNCTVCTSLFGKIFKISKEFDVALNFVQFEDLREISSKFSVFTAPLVIVFAGGKEIFRSGKFLQINELKYTLEKYIKLIRE